MTTVPLASCRSCGAPVKWCKTETGKRIPMNPTPDPDGIWLIWPTLHTPTIMRPTAQTPHEVARYTSHFATCPEASTWRRAR
jgi:hypothetical protein